MTLDRALELVQAVFHDLRRDQVPYLAPEVAKEVLEFISEIREKENERTAATH